MKRLLICLTVCFCLLVPLCHAEETADELNFYFVNVRLGDCMILQCGGQTIMIDGGYRTQFGYVTTFLESHGITALDAMINTHCHDDHADGLSLLLDRQFPVEQLYGVQPEEYNNPIHQTLMSKARENGVPYTVLNDGDSMQVGDATLQFFRYPCVNKASTLNRGSMVILLTYRDCRMLLCGDIDHTAQLWLMENHPEILACDILKIPHHGIGWVEREFLAACSPEYGIMTSNGYDTVAAARKQLQYAGVYPMWMRGIITLHITQDDWSLTQANRYVVVPPHKEAEAL